MILLINPWIYDFAAYDLWSFPLGLLMIGGLLEKWGFEVKLTNCLDRFHPGMQELMKHCKALPDGRGKYYREEVPKPEVLSWVKNRRFCRYGIKEEIFIEELQNHKPDCVFITSAMTYWYLGPRRVAKLVREIYPDVPLVLGGIYARLMPEHANIEGSFDYVISELFPLQLPEILSLIYKKDFRTLSPPISLIDFPLPSFHLLTETKTLPIITSWGCVFNCSFCASRLLFPRFEQKPYRKVIEELVIYKEKFNAQNLAFYDDALLWNRDKHILPMLKELDKTGIKFQFHTPNGLFVNLINEELSQWLAKSNFKTIRLSFDTADIKRQKEIKKVTNVGLERAFSFLEKAGYKRSNIEVYIIVGLPGQGYGEVVASMKFVNSLGGKIKLADFSPIPGTGAWKEAVEKFNWVPPSDPLLHNCSLFPLAGKGITTEEFYQLKQLAGELNSLL